MTNINWRTIKTLKKSLKKNSKVLSPLKICIKMLLIFLWKLHYFFYITSITLKEMKFYYLVQLNKTSSEKKLVLIEKESKSNPSQELFLTLIRGQSRDQTWILWRLNFVSALFSLTNCWKRSPERFLILSWETRKGLLFQYLMIVEFPFNQKFKQNRNVKSRSSHR